MPVAAYSQTAFRETLANALIHRDYTRRGAVHIQWSAHQLEISSPGGFPTGISLDNLLVAPPHPRSPLLADAFKRAGLLRAGGHEHTEPTPARSCHDQRDLVRTDRG